MAERSNDGATAFLAHAFEYANDTQVTGGRWRPLPRTVQAVAEIATTLAPLLSPAPVWPWKVRVGENSPSL